VSASTSVLGGLAALLLVGARSAPRVFDNR